MLKTPEIDVVGTIFVEYQEAVRVGINPNEAMGLQFGSMHVGNFCRWAED